MVPHMSGTTLDAQARYATGVKNILDNYFNDKPQNPPDIIIGKSELSGYHAADPSDIQLTPQSSSFYSRLRDQSL